MNKKLLQMVAAPAIIALAGTTSVQAKGGYGHHHHAHGHPGIKHAVRQIKSEIDDLDQRVSNLEDTPTQPPTPDYSGYGLPFSPDGAPRNVIVTAQSRLDGSVVYRMRIRWASSTETLSINGVATQRPFFAAYSYVDTDASGNVRFASNYIEAPDTANYVNYNVEESTYNFATGQFEVDNDTLREEWSCGGSQILICTVSVILSATGESDSAYSWSSARALGGPVTVNGMTFTDVRFEEMLNADNTRIRAKGIGEIYRITSSGERKVVYYRVDGAEGGSLAGTPFDTGGELAGVFF